MPSSGSLSASEPAAHWWAGKIRQTWRYMRSGLSPAERADLAAWLSEPQRRLFESMHPADRRHGMDVVTSLRRAGHHDLELLLAGLLHDAAKGPETRLWHRVAWSLGERFGSRAFALAELLPGFRAALARIRHHPERSAELALAAGCSPVTAELIRHQAEPPAAGPGLALKLADDAN
jgi:hypothetical protein